MGGHNISSQPSAVPGGLVYNVSKTAVRLPLSLKRDTCLSEMAYMSETNLFDLIGLLKVAASFTI